MTGVLLRLHRRPPGRQRPGVAAQRRHSRPSGRGCSAVCVSVWVAGTGMPAALPHALSGPHRRQQWPVLRTPDQNGLLIALKAVGTPIPLRLVQLLPPPPQPPPPQPPPPQPPPPPLQPLPLQPPPPPPPPPPAAAAAAADAAADAAAAPARPRPDAPPGPPRFTSTFDPLT